MAHCAMSGLLLITIFTVMLMMMIVAQDSDKESKDKTWKDFKEKFGKKYKNDDEETKKRAVFEETVKKIEEHNAAADKSYTMGVNQFTDMTNEEFKAVMLVDLTEYVNKERDTVQSGGRSKRTVVPASVDYRTSGCISPIRYQGQCGSCWAFGAVAALEYYNCKKYSYLYTLSEQQLVDCVYTTHSGCDGGWTSDAYDYVKNHGLISPSSLYPYTGQYGSCKSGTTYSFCTGYVSAANMGDELGLANYVGLIGPVTVGLDASQFQHYASGIFYSEACSSIIPNHAVAVVGYGTLNGYDYWLIRNSWGTTWGESGYMKLYRNYYNHCGVANYAQAPTV